MMKCDASDHAQFCQAVWVAVSDITKLLLLGSNPGGSFIQKMPLLSLMLIGRGVMPITSYTRRFQQYSGRSTCRRCQRINH